MDCRGLRPVQGHGWWLPLASSRQVPPAWRCGVECRAAKSGVWRWSTIDNERLARHGGDGLVDGGEEFDLVVEVEDLDHPSQSWWWRAEEEAPVRAA
jgi:hypothetical protein